MKRIKEIAESPRALSLSPHPRAAAAGRLARQPQAGVPSCTAESLRFRNKITQATDRGHILFIAVKPHLAHPYS
jgi:hypothetical protein